jgi:hypothetical protein
MLTVRLIGAEGNQAKVNGEGELNVVVHPHPPRDEVFDVFPFRQYFTDDGTATGSNDMIVSGTVASPENFYISASTEYDIYIKYISVNIGDGGTPALNKFGALSALTNGVKWTWFNQEAGDYELHEGIKTNLEFIRLASDTAAIGSGTDAFLADTSGGGTEKNYLPNINMSETFGLPWGLRLKKGTEDRVVFGVQDNMAGLLTFNAIAYGIRL